MTQQEKESKLAALEKAIAELQQTPIDTPEQLIERLQKRVADLEAENLRLKIYKLNDKPPAPSDWPFPPHNPPAIWCGAQ